MKIAKMPIWPSDSPRYRPPSDSTTPDQEAADECAHEAAHAAQHHDGEGHQHEAAAHLRVDVVRGQQEAGRGAQARQADAEAHGVHMVDVDAHEFGALLLLGDRADGAAQVGAAHDPEQHARHHQRTGEGNELGHRDHGRADGHGAQRVGGVDAAGVRLEEQQRQVLHDDGDAQRGQQDVLVLAVAGIVDDDALQRVAEREHAGDGDGQRQVGVDAEALLQEVHGVQRQHQAAPWAKLMMCSTP
jgi:hypothetical protein